MGSTPKISVIIPVYNRPSLVKEAIESVLQQTFKQFELILVDDGSDDETPSLLAHYAKISKQISVLTLPSHNGMPGLVRNRGVSKAVGEYIAFLDSDDLWEREKLERQYHYMEQRGCSLSHTKELWLREGRVVSQRKQRHQREGALFVDSLKKCIIGPSTVMIKRELFTALKGFKEELEIAEDYELWIRATERSSVGYIDWPLTVKRAGLWSQLSEKYGQIEIFRIKALQMLAKEENFSTQHRELLIKELERKRAIYAAGAKKRGRSGDLLE